MIDVPDDVLLSVYAEVRSVWKTGARVGLSGQQVHSRLKRLGANRPVNILTAADEETIRRYYLETEPALFDLTALAASLGRTRNFVCRNARKLGLTDLRRPMAAAARERMAEARAGYWSGREHPRGMAGKKHTAETLAKVSVSSRAAWDHAKATGTGLMSPELRRRRSKMAAERAQRRSPGESYSRAKRGVRPDIGPWFFRSSWEANYARFLQFMVRRGIIDRWEYEPERFVFPGVTSGPASYLPDFKVWDPDDGVYFVEIKGWYDRKSRQRFALMAKHYPDVPIRVVGEEHWPKYEALGRRAIPGWEHYERHAPKITPLEPQEDAA